jgi:hypothetical protein
LVIRAEEGNSCEKEVNNENNHVHKSSKTMTQPLELEQQKQQRLRKKRIWISSVLGFFIPIAPYFYTQRWKPLLWLGGTAFGVFFLMETIAPTDNMKNAFQRGQNVGPLMSLITITDNWLAISRARKRFQGEEDKASES